MLGGDFRQIFSIVKKRSIYDIVKSSINYSNLWQHCTILKHSQNMRLKTAVYNEKFVMKVQYL